MMVMGKDGALLFELVPIKWFGLDSLSLESLVFPYSFI
jgi:hypothetical protein